MTKYIPVITRGYSRKVPVDDIMYLEQTAKKISNSYRRRNLSVIPAHRKCWTAAAMKGFTTR